MKGQRYAEVISESLQLGSDLQEQHLEVIMHWILLPRRCVARLLSVALTVVIFPPVVDAEVTRAVPASDSEELLTTIERQDEFPAIGCAAARGSAVARAAGTT